MQVLNESNQQSGNQQSGNQQNNENVICPICNKQVSNASNIFVFVPCNHAYHISCLERLNLSNCKLCQ